MCDFKKWPQAFADKQVKTIFGGHTKKTVGKSCTTTFWASVGKFGQKSFAPSKNFLTATPMTGSK